MEANMPLPMDASNISWETRVASLMRIFDPQILGYSYRSLQDLIDFVLIERKQGTWSTSKSMATIVNFILCS